MARTLGRGRINRVVAKDGGVSYVAHFSDGSGIRRRVTVGHDRRTAEQALSKLIRDRDLELVGIAPERGLDREVSEIVEQYIETLRQRSSPRLVAETESTLGRMVDGMALRLVRHVSRERVSAWRDARVRAGTSHKRANNEVGMLRAALNHAVSLGQIPSDPLLGLKSLPTTAKHQRRRPRALTEDEIARLLDAACRADDSARAPRRVQTAPAAPPPVGWLFDPNPVTPEPSADGPARDPIPREPLLRALVATGARWNEIVSTTWADLDVSLQTLRLRAETTKTQTARVVPLDPELVESLRRVHALQAVVLGRAPAAADRIFLTPEGKAWPRDGANFRRWMRGVMQAAGIPYRDETGRVVHIHALRHTFATRLARAGVGVATAQQLTGHKSAQVLLGIYTHVSSEEAREAIRKLPPLPGPQALPRERAARPGSSDLPPPSAAAQ